MNIDLNYFDEYPEALEKMPISTKEYVKKLILFMNSKSENHSIISNPNLLLAKNIKVNFVDFSIDASNSRIKTNYFDFNNFVVPNIIIDMTINNNEFILKTFFNCTEVKNSLEKILEF